MTDAETITRLRASDIPPGEFLAAMERIDDLADAVVEELEATRRDRDVWRFSCVASWGFWLLTMLGIWGLS